MADSKCRHNYHEESEALINQQINIKLNAYYHYMAQSAFYERDNVGLKGFAKYFRELGDQENEHAQKLIQYQNLRGGRSLFSDLSRPSEQEWASPLVAIEASLNLKKKGHQSLLDLDKVANNHDDPHLSDFLKKDILREQVETINKLANHHTNLLRVGDGLGVYIYDKHFLKE